MEKKYSDWLKIDLHIHTDRSRLTKENDYKGSFTVSSAKSKLIENNVKIFSFTDHNIINLDAYEEYYCDYTPTDPLLLLGIELDISVKRNQKQRTYHTLIIFNCCEIDLIKKISEKLENKYLQKAISNLKDRQLTIEEIVELFPSEDYFFIPHAYSDRNIVTAYKDGSIQDAQKMVLLMQCALEKVTKQEIIATYEQGFNTLLSNNFRSKNDIPYINFSDNHCIENYPCKHMGDNDIGNHDFYYIKGSKCYESIRLAFIDPESRIKTAKEFNALNHNNNTIDLLSIKGDTIITDTVLEFSPHLNVIIGGRSSGKSLLMWLLGNKIDALSLDNKYTKINPDKILIKSRNDLGLTLITSGLQNFIYIKQGDIINYFEAGELKELAKKSNKNVEYQNALSLFEEQKTKLTHHISEFIATYRIIIELGQSKQFILHDKIIDSILSPHFILKVDSDGLLNKYNKIDKIAEAEIILNRILGDIESLAKFEILNISAVEGLSISNFVELIKNKIVLLNLSKKNNSKRISFIHAINKIVNETNSGLKIEAREKESSIMAFTSFKKDIKERFKKHKELKIKSFDLETFDASFKQSFSINDGINLVLETAHKYVIKSEILDGINSSDSSSSLYINTLKLLAQKITIKNYGGNNTDNFSKKIHSQLFSCLTDLTSPKDFLEYEDRESSKEKSPGYNSEKYLEIILKNPNTGTIFIDQPEDNLGNKFIADVLVRIIRKIKFQKQIFLVTHNPSVVVYGDAESIILAKNIDNQISYEQIVLEDRIAQKEICSILDGGEYIFNNRSKKYNIQRILKEA